MYLSCLGATSSFCDDAGPPGGALAFGSFAELPIPLHHAGSQPQNGPGLAQQRSGSLSQGPSQQIPYQHQQQTQRRGSSGPRNSQGFKGPNYDAGHAGQQGAMHPSAPFNPMQSTGHANYMAQQPYQYAQQGYYPGAHYGSMMVPQGGYQQQQYSAPQPPSRSQQQAQGYQRPQAQPGRLAAMAQPQPQQSPPNAPAVPAIRRNKALAIVDPATQKIISPRSEYFERKLLHVCMMRLPPRDCTLSNSIQIHHHITHSVCPEGLAFFMTLGLGTACGAALFMPASCDTCQVHCTSCYMLCSKTSQIKSRWC